MENFHVDILENILFRLPFRAALQATQVCKAWKTLLANRCCNEVGFLISYSLSGNKDVQLYYGEQYDQIHGDVDHGNKMMNYYYGRFHQKFKGDHLVVGSCNGLICLRKRDQLDEIQYLICNPLTGEYVFVPQFDYTSLQDGDGVLVRRKSWLRNGELVSDGFGYCHLTKEFKVIRIYYSKVNVGNILIYTVGSHEWRNIGILRHGLCSSSGVFVNGFLHWLTFDILEQKVFSFDLKDEKHQLLSMPPCVQLVDRQLKLLGGNLCIVLANHCACNIEIWAHKNMKEHNQSCGYHNNSRNWVKEFSIDTGNDRYFGSFEPFAVTRSNQVLLWHRGSNLYSYDPRASTVNKLWDHILVNGMSCSRIEAIPYTNSFVSLKDLGESGAKSCKYETRQYTRQAKRKR